MCKLVTTGILHILHSGPLTKLVFTDLRYKTDFKIVMGSCLGYHHVRPTLLQNANFSTKYFPLSNVYTGDGGREYLKLKLADYLLLQVDKP